MSPTEDFLMRWRAVVALHASATPEERDALIVDLLENGLPPGEPAVPPDVTTTERAAAEAHLVRTSGSFDDLGYFWHSPDLTWRLCGHDEELWHFIRTGWKELRNPNPSFDLWFYWNEHLDPTTEAINPLIYYLIAGSHLGHATLPTVETREPPESPEPDWQPRRACLFAGFDPDGILDRTVLAYIVELSRFADVYYLADCSMDDGELDKLAPYTKGRWALRHGRYDFGSYSMLADELVGWDVLDGYDEVLLTNDSCYLVQPLDRVFERMDHRACDWWGLQATYQRFDTHQFQERGGPLPIDELERAMREIELWRYFDFAHVGSYFLAFRRRVLDDPRFRRRLGEVAQQTDKTRIILKYEIGFSRLLILGGYRVSTFVDGVLPYHPIYRESAFDLLCDGFPVLKRQFLFENPIDTPDLHRWQARVLEVVPDADVAGMQRNLRRVAPIGKLLRSFSIRTMADGTVTPAAAGDSDTFAEVEAGVPRHPHWWVFTVDPRSGVLAGASRAVFEEVRHDGGVKKIVLYNDREPRLGAGRNVVVARGESAEGQIYALRAALLFVTVGPRADLKHPLSYTDRRFVMLGDPALTGLRDAAADPAAQHDVDLTRVVVVESTEALARAASAYPHVPHEMLWLTGNPRRDLLMRPERALPTSMQEQLDVLRAMTGARPLVVVSIDSADAQHVASELAEALGDSAVVVIRVPGSTNRDPRLTGPRHLALSAYRFPDPEMAWRLARVVVTDSREDREDLAVTPATVVRPDRDDLLEAVHSALGVEAEAPVLGPLDDGHAARRVVRQAKRLYLPIDEWEAEWEAEVAAQAFTTSQ